MSSEFVIPKLMGGLGNYMFQIAAAYSLAIDNNCELIIDLNDISVAHKPITNYINNIFRKIKFSEEKISPNYTHIETNFGYHPISNKSNLKIQGYFQSEKYFNHNREKILELFSIDDFSLEEINKKYKKILEGDTCSIHVRRGDYLYLPTFHPSCTENYFFEAIKKFSEDTFFLVFSDDLTWCKKTFVGDRFIFIEEDKDFLELWLMSMCKNNIISNSTFSWWAAWLNVNDTKKIVTPKKWFGPSLNHSVIDLIPDKWIKI